MSRPDVTDWIGKNLWAILAVAFGLYGGYLTGKTEMEGKITRLEEKVATLEKNQADRRNFMICAVRTLDRIMDKTGVQQACPLVVAD